MLNKLMCLIVLVSLTSCAWYQGYKEEKQAKLHNVQAQGSAKTAEQTSKDSQQVF